MLRFFSDIKRVQYRTRKLRIKTKILRLKKEVRTGRYLVGELKTRKPENRTILEVKRRGLVIVRTGHVCVALHAMHMNDI